METSHPNSINPGRYSQIGKESTALTPPSVYPEERTASEQALATASYHKLVLKLGQDLSYASGWRGTVAGKLGISGSLLSQILNGRKVTRGTLEKAILALHLPPDYFGRAEEVQAVPRTPIPPPAHEVHIVDPLVIFEAFRALPAETRKRLLGLLKMVDPETGNVIG